MLLFSTNQISGLGADAPIGTVISFMGTEAPPGYLACDGSQHSISDYPYLAQHFADDFGKSNYFGGDGTSTFAVPDLRGEFLRGTGTASRNTGSGAAVGTHQDATQHVSSIAGLNNALYAKSNGPDNWRTVLEDKIVRQNTKIYIGTSGYSDYNLTGASKTYTSRPTNTSILYCIKATLDSGEINNQAPTIQGLTFHGCTYGSGGYIKMGRVVVLNISVNIPSSVSSGTDIIKGIPATAVPYSAFRFMTPQSTFADCYVYGKALRVHSSLNSGTCIISCSYISAN